MSAKTEALLVDALREIVGAYHQRFADASGRLLGPIDEPIEVAQRLLQQLDTGRRLPERCTSEEFSSLIRGVAMSPTMRAALRLVLVEGSTWKQASSTCGVSESGILRALRRVAQNPPGT